MNACVETHGGDKLSAEDFARIYEECLDGTLAFSDIGAGHAHVGRDAMVKAVKTFDHHNTGFISLNELRFGKLCDDDDDAV